MGKKSGFGSLLTGMALGAAAIFFAKKENRDKTEKLARKTVAKTKEEVKKVATKAKAAVKKAKSKGKKIKAEVEMEAKKIQKIAKAKK